MSALYPVWSGDRWIEVPVPVSGDEPVVVPNVNGVVFPSPSRSHVLLQRRDKPDEPVRGLLEVPGGRWRAGESPDEAIRREVLEETGITLTAVAGAIHHHPRPPHGVATVAMPAAVVVGRGGAYPSLHVVFECVGEGEPRGLPGEAVDPRWWRVDEVKGLLDETPEAFVGVAASILETVLTR